MVKLIIHKNEAEQRLDKFLLKYLDQAGTSFLYKMLRKKNITLNGRKAAGGEHLKEGDEVTLFLSDETIAKFHSPEKPAPTSQVKKPAGLKPDIIYEDEDLLFLSKPAGLLSQKAAPEDYSVNDLVLDYIRRNQNAEERSAAFTPSVCNRLDRNTSGLITAGKTLAGLQFLSGCFRNRSVDKYYLALVCGVMDKNLHLSGWLIKDEKTNRVSILKSPQEDADAIETELMPLENNGSYTLVKLKLLTGKTHQLRAVLADLGHPVIGDPKYGDETENRRIRALMPLRFQLLHAWELSFPKLEGRFERLGGKDFYAPLPAPFRKCLNILNLKIPNVTTEVSHG